MRASSRTRGLLKGPRVVSLWALLKQEALGLPTRGAGRMLEQMLNYFHSKNYDSLNVRKVSDKLNKLSDEKIKRLRDYEVRNKNRTT